MSQETKVNTGNTPQHKRINGFNVRVGLGVTQYDLIELIEEGPRPKDPADAGTRRFLVVDGQAGHEQLAVTLEAIRRRKQETEAGQEVAATVTIRMPDSEPPDRARILPITDVVRSALVASSVDMGYLDTTGTGLGAEVLGLDFQPTGEPGHYAIAA